MYQKQEKFDQRFGKERYELMRLRRNKICVDDEFANNSPIRHEAEKEHEPLFVID